MWYHLWLILMRDISICLAWPIYMCHGEFICVLSLICTWYDPFICDITNSYVWHDSFMWHMTHFDVRHDSFTCVTWLIYTWLVHTCDMTHSCIGHAPFTRDTPHSHVTHLIHTYHDLCTRMYILRHRHIQPSWTRCKKETSHFCDVTHLYIFTQNVKCLRRDLFIYLNIKMSRLS